MPDMRGRTSVGVDSNGNRVTTNNILGASSGEEKHQLTVDELAKHSHSVQFMKPGGAFQVHADGAKLVVMPKTANDQGVEITSLNSTGYNQPHNNMQPYLVLNYIIKTGEESTNQLNRTAQRDIELDSQRSEIAQLKQEINSLKIASAKAWVIFNGTNTTILDSYNIASVVRNNLGNYTINFAKPFNSTNYCSLLKAGDGEGDCPHAFGPYASQPTRTNFRFMIMNFPGKPFDAPFISACFFGN